MKMMVVAIVAAKCNSVCLCSFCPNITYLVCLATQLLLAWLLLLERLLLFHVNDADAIGVVFT